MKKVKLTYKYNQLSQKVTNFHNNAELIRVSQNGHKEGTVHL